MSRRTSWTIYRPARVARPDVAHDTACRREIINFYFANNWDTWAYMALIGLAFYGWLALNYCWVRARTPDLEMPLRYLRPVWMVEPILRILNGNKKYVLLIYLIFLYKLNKI